MELSTYQKLAAELFEEIQDGLDRYQDDFDYEFGQSKLVIEPIKQSATYVINTQQAALQIWMAGEATAWHFDWDQEKQSWEDLKNGVSFWPTVNERLSKLVGKAIQLNG